MSDAAPDGTNGKDAAEPPDAAPGDTGAADTASDSSTVVTLVGDDRGGTIPESLDTGYARAFPFVATATGNAGSLFIQLHATNNAKDVEVGLYADSGFDHAGQLLARGRISSAAAGWNVAVVPAAFVRAGTQYWLAVLSTSATPVTFDEDQQTATGYSEIHGQANLTELPTTWSPGATFQTPSMCVYAAAL